MKSLNPYPTMLNLTLHMQALQSLERGLDGWSLLRGWKRMKTLFPNLNPKPCTRRRCGRWRRAWTAGACRAGGNA